jgi:hypothetical protein
MALSWLLRDGYTQKKAYQTQKQNLINIINTIKQNQKQLDQKLTQIQQQYAQKSGNTQQHSETSQKKPDHATRQNASDQKNNQRTFTQKDKQAASSSIFLSNGAPKNMPEKSSIPNSDRSQRSAMKQQSNRRNIKRNNQNQNKEASKKNIKGDESDKTQHDDSNINDDFNNDNNGISGGGSSGPSRPSLNTNLKVTYKANKPKQIAFSYKPATNGAPSNGEFDFKKSNFNFKQTAIQQPSISNGESIPFVNLDNIQICGISGNNCTNHISTSDDNNNPVFKVSNKKIRSIQTKIGFSQLKIDNDVFFVPSFHIKASEKDDTNHQYNLTINQSEHLSCQEVQNSKVDKVECQLTNNFSQTFTID